MVSSHQVLEKSTPLNLSLNLNLFVWVIDILVGIYTFFLIGIVVAPFFQKDFFHPTLLVPFFLMIAGSQFNLSIYLWNFDKITKNQKNILFLFLINSILISFFIGFTGWHHSICFILYLLNIAGCGVVLTGTSSLWISVFTSIGFNIAILYGPEFNGLESVLYLVLNNLSFFATSYLTTYVHEEFVKIEFKLSQTESDLHSLKNIHEIVLKNIPSYVILIDEQGHLVSFNKTIFNYIDQDVLQKQLLSDVFKQEITEIKILNKNNKFNYFKVKFGSLNLKDGDFIKTAKLFVLDDVTELRNIEWNMREQEKLAAVGKLAAGIAHEIRNPLASISGSVQLLSQQAHSDEDRKLFGIVVKETDRLNNLISDFLNYSRPLEKPTEKINISNVLSEVLELLKYDKKLDPQVQLKTEVQDQLYIYGYSDKLKQSFLNIIINAYHAMEKSEQKKLEVSLLTSQNNILFSVRDSGCGMNEEVRKRLFEPFFTTKSRGTGLGLAVTHKIFEAHGASILVESEVGIGTLFVITFKKADSI